MSAENVGLESLADLRKIELKRFSKALDISREKLFLQGLLQHQEQKISQKKFCNYARCIELSELLISRLMEEILENLSLTRENDRGRPKWETYVSGLRFVARFFRKGYFSNVVFPLLGMEEVAVYINSLAEHSLKVLNDIQRSSAAIELYAANYSRAAEQTKAINRKEERLCLKYASLKTWGDSEEELSKFVDYLRDAFLGSIEIFIEGPIKLYVMLGRDRFLLILRALTAERLSEMEEMDKYLFDALGILTTLSILIEKSDLLNTLRELLPEALSQYVKLWEEEQDSICKELPTRELRRLFIQRFEDGTLFIEK